MRQHASRDPLLTTAMFLFAVGLLALGVMFGLFAAGHRRLPMWLSLSGLLLALGLILGMFRTRRRTARRDRSTGTNAATD